jgi:UDP-sulfoquinovose synthase
MFCCRVWGLRCTDLNQGIVYGAQTEQTLIGPGLATRYDYDHIYGTALNRFCVQAVLGQAISVHGSGGQTRGYIDIRDTVCCIELAILNPPAHGEYRVFNQITERFSLTEIAEKVADAARAMGYPAKIDHLPNPRVEAEEHYYRAVHTRLDELGLRPHLLDKNTISTLLELAASNAGQVDLAMIAPKVDWRRLSNQVRDNT